MNIAIDGPAGAGKSTIAKIVASKTGNIYVDTGAMYRAMAVFFISKGIDADDTEAVEANLNDANVTIRHEGGEQVVILNGENVNGKLRTEEVGNMASRISVIASVRRKLVDLQRDLARTTDVVMDGRDIGTVVLPDAKLKIFLTAGADVRAERRFKELAAKGIEADIKQIEADIIERDNRDMNRSESPLKQAPDAVVIDSSYMTIDEVADKILGLAEERREKQNAG
ncbi:MAG: (d)CMP kinase [Lachnospiraceae bacterium]|nr:(d)CMP kinase [Lachnospiraceae bacterium]